MNFLNYDDRLLLLTKYKLISDKIGMCTSKTVTQASFILPEIKLYLQETKKKNPSFFLTMRFFKNKLFFSFSPNIFLSLKISFLTLFKNKLVMLNKLGKNIFKRKIVWGFFIYKFSL